MTSSTDPDNYRIYYKWDWGDGNFGDWLGLYDSGKICKAKHTLNYDEKKKIMTIWNIFAYVTKPFSDDELVEVVNRALKEEKVQVV